MLPRLKKEASTPQKMMTPRICDASVKKLL
jgi:hypothetical protein